MKIHILFLFLFVVLSQNIFAAESDLRLFETSVEKVKKNRVIFAQPKGVLLNLSDRIEFLDVYQNVISVAEILDVRDERVLGVFLNSEKVNEGDKYLFRIENREYVPKRGYMLGAHFVYSMQEISARQDSHGQSVVDPMVGSAAGVEFSGDYLFNKRYVLNLNLGYESLEVKGSGSSCNGGLACQLKTDSLTSTALGKIRFVNNDFDYWVGAGLKVKYSLSKESNSINQEDLTFFHSITGQLGLEYKVDDFNYLSTRFIYDYSLNTSKDVPKIDSLGFSLGYIWQL